MNLKYSKSYHILSIIFNFFIFFCSANDGALDTSFGTNGEVTTSFANNTRSNSSSIIQQSDGKLVAVGVTGIGFNLSFAVARYDLDGNLDKTFNGTGKIIGKKFADFPINAASSVIQQSNSKLVVAGLVSNTSVPQSTAIGITRYNSNGSLDNSFGNLGQVTTLINGNNSSGSSMKVLPNDEFVIAGNSFPSSSTSQFALATYDPNGKLLNQNSFHLTKNPTNADFANSVAVQKDGKFVISGTTKAAVTSKFAIVRTNSDTSLDKTFGNNGIVIFNFGGTDDECFAVAIQQDGKIVVAGYTAITAKSQFAIARLNSNGTFDETFGTSGKVVFNFAGNRAQAKSLVLQSDGKIIVAGLTSTGPISNFALARLLPNGSLDPSFGTKGKVITSFENSKSSQAESVIIQQDGKIVADGFEITNNTSKFAIARYINSVEPTCILDIDSLTKKIIKKYNI